MQRLWQTYRLRRLRGASPNTIRISEIALRHFDRFLGHPATLDDLTDDTVAAFAIWRRQCCQVAPATVNRDLNVLLALWRWGHKTEAVPRWPDVRLEKLPEHTPIAWQQDEFESLLRAAQRLSGDVGRYPAPLWWTALLLVCFDTGERIGAVLLLTWQRVDIRHRWVDFAALTRKGRQTDNTVRIAPDTAAALKKIQRPSGLVFPWPYCKQYLWKRMGMLLTDAGLPCDRWRKFHCIRRTTASHYEAAGGNATELLKHASRKTTLAYLDPRVTKPVQAIDLLWRPKLQ